MFDFLLTCVLGGMSAFGFFNPNSQYLIPLSLIIFLFIHPILKPKHLTHYFLSLHTLGSLWLLVPIHFIGGVNYMLSCLVILLLGSSLGYIYGLTYQAFIAINKKSHAHMNMIILLPSSIVTAEYVKFHFIGGYPFLLYSHFFVNTHYQFIIPFLGNYGCCWLLICLCCTLVYFYKHKRYVQLSILIISLLSIHYINLAAPKFNVEKNPISVYIVHTNKHYVTKNQLDKNPTNLDLNTDANLILYPESMHQSLKSIHRNTSQQYTLTGLINYDEQQHGFRNTMIGINGDNQIDFIHNKHHLAQFNEWIPNGIQSILKAFKLPHQGFIAGNGEDTNGRINDVNFMSLICYEILFSNFIYHNINDAQMIILNNDLGWFEHSLFTNYYFQNAKLIALLTQKPIVISSNVAPSANITSDGKITFYNDNQLVNIVPNQGKTPWMYYGDNGILSLIFLLNLILYFQQKKEH